MMMMKLNVLMLSLGIALLFAVAQGRVNTVDTAVCAETGVKFLDSGRVVLASCKRFWTTGPAIVFPKVNT